jgi:hypothetical protein
MTHLAIEELNHLRVLQHKEHAWTMSSHSMRVHTLAWAVLSTAGDLDYLWQALKPLAETSLCAAIKSKLRCICFGFQDHVWLFVH